MREQGAVDGREERISGTLCLYRAVGTPRLGREVYSGEDVHVGAARLLTRYLARAVVIYDPRDKLGTVAYGAYLGDTGYLVRRTHDADDPEFRGACEDVFHASGVAIGKVPASVTLVVVVALGHDVKLESQQPLEGISVIKARDADILAHHKVNGHLADALEVCQASGIGEVVGHASVMVADDDGFVVGVGHVAGHDLVGTGARFLVVGDLAQQRRCVRQDVRDGPLTILAKDVIKREVVEDGHPAILDDLPTVGVIEVDADVIVALDVIGILPDVRTV